MNCRHDQVEPSRISDEVTLLRCRRCGEIVGHWYHLEDEEKSVEGEPRKLSYKEKKLLS